MLLTPISKWVCHIWLSRLSLFFSWVEGKKNNSAKQPQPAFAHCNNRLCLFLEKNRFQVEKSMCEICHCLKGWAQSARICACAPLCVFLHNTDHDGLQCLLYSLKKTTTKTNKTKEQHARPSIHKVSEAIFHSNHGSLSASKTT